LDCLSIILPHFGQPLLDIIIDSGLGHAKLVGDGLLGSPGLFQLEDLGPSHFSGYSGSIL